jgi:hypothetical protein
MFYQEITNNQSRSTTTSPIAAEELLLSRVSQKLSEVLVDRPGYLAVKGAWGIKEHFQSFDLQTQVEKFLKGEKKVLLVLGDSGSGKSLYCQQLASALFRQFQNSLSNKEAAPLPLLISLPRLKKTSRAIAETLEDLGLSAEEIALLKNHQEFVFILDGYDELREWKNLYVTNRLGEWKAKVLITCRSQYLFRTREHSHYFMPYRGEHPQSSLYSEVFIRPFDTKQVEDYVRYYAEQVSSESHDWKLYQKYLHTIPGLSSLTSNPFLLRLALDAMPRLVALHETNPNEVEHLRLTQARLYDVFVEGWLQRQEDKLKNNHKLSKEADFKPKLWAYHKALATTMHEQKVTVFTYKRTVGLFEQTTDNVWAQYFDSRDQEVSLCQEASLLESYGTDLYGFMHASLIDYFYARELYECSNQLDFVKGKGKEKEKTPASVSTSTQVREAGKVPERLLQDKLNQQLIVKETELLQFLADRVIESEGYKRTLFQWIELSKEHSDVAIAAANAITILNRAREIFSGMSLAGIRIPSAELEGAIFDGTNLQGADLRGVNFRGAWLQNADCREAQFEGVGFGENPHYVLPDEVLGCYTLDDGSLIAVLKDRTRVYFYDVINKQRLGTILTNEKEINSDWKPSVAVHPQSRMLVALTKEKTVDLHCIPSAERIYTFIPLKDKDPVSIALSKDGKLLAIGHRDGSVAVWSTETYQYLNMFEGKSYCGLTIFNNAGNTLATRNGNDIN